MRLWGYIPGLLALLCACQNSEIAEPAATLQATSTIAGARFGSAIDVDGDLAVVGAHASNSVYILERSSAWDIAARIEYPGTAQGALFGAAVALSGNLLAVATSGDCFPCQEVFVFRQGEVPSEWSLIATIEPVTQEFGTDIDLLDNRLFVGDPLAGEDVGDTGQSGRVFVYLQDQDGTDNFGLAGEIDSSLTVTGDRLGQSVAIEGNTLAVGVPNFMNNRGAVIAYDLSAGLDQPTYVTLMTDSGKDNLGVSVDIYGGTVYGGAPSDETDDVGSVWVFESDGMGWTATEVPNPLINGFFERFGEDVAVDGNLMLVAAPGKVAANQSVGAVKVFTGGGATWTHAGDLYDPTGTSEDRFAGAVALAGGDILIGAPDAGGSQGGGKVVTVDFTTAPPDLTDATLETLLPSVGASYTLLGDAVAISGNYAVVGEPLSSIDAPFGGAAHVFFREPQSDIWEPLGPLQPPVSALGSRCGHAVAIEGSRIAIGCPGAGDVAINGGVVRVYELTQNGSWAYQSSAYGEAVDGHGFGTSIDMSGDQLVVGAQTSTLGAGQMVYIFEHDGAQFVSQFKATVGASDDTRIQVAAGDDVAVATVSVKGLDGATAAKGELFSFTPEPTDGWAQTDTFSLADTEGLFGSSLDLLGDRLIVGSHGTVGLGAARVYRNVNGTWELETTLSGNTPGAGFGKSVAIGNGIVLIGQQNNGSAAGERVFGYSFGSSEPNQVWQSTSAVPGQGFAGALAVDGDLAVVGEPARLAPSPYRRGAAHVIDLAASGVSGANSAYNCRSNNNGLSFVLLLAFLSLVARRREPSHSGNADQPKADCF